MRDRDLQTELENVITGLDWQKASWINKHFIIDLQDKATVLLSSLARFKDDSKELKEVENTVTEFINTIQPVIQQIKDEEL